MRSEYGVLACAWVGSGTRSETRFGGADARARAGAGETGPVAGHRVPYVEPIYFPSRV